MNMSTIPGMSIMEAIHHTDPDSAERCPAEIVGGSNTDWWHGSENIYNKTISDTTEEESPPTMVESLQMTPCPGDETETRWWETTWGMVEAGVSPQPTTMSTTESTVENYLDHHMEPWMPWLPCKGCWGWIKITCPPCWISMALWTTSTTAYQMCLASLSPLVWWTQLSEDCLQCQHQVSCKLLLWQLSQLLRCNSNSSRGAGSASCSSEDPLQHHSKKQTRDCNNNCCSINNSPTSTNSSFSQVNSTWCSLDLCSMWWPLLQPVWCQLSPAQCCRVSSVFHCQWAWTRFLSSTLNYSLSRWWWVTSSHISHNLSHCLSRSRSLEKVGEDVERDYPRFQSRFPLYHQTSHQDTRTLLRRLKRTCSWTE